MRPTSRLALTFIAGLALIGLGACTQDIDDTSVELKVPVRVADVGTGTVEDLVRTTGTLRVAQVVSLSADTAGELRIARRSGRRLAEGDKVRAGQLIAEVTGEDVKLAARTESTLARYEQAMADLEAQQALFDDGLINATALRAAETTAAEARLELDRSARTEKKKLLTTPISGVVLSLARGADQLPMTDGQLVSPGQVLAQIAPTTKLIADVDLIGDDVIRVEVDQLVRIRHPAIDQPFEGTVLRLAPTLDTTTRTLRAEVEVINREGILRPGMFVEVTVVLETREGVTVVPREALTERGGQRVVFSLAGQMVAKRELALGLGDDEVVEVLSGVEPGDRVVVRGLETLTDGTRVQVR